MIPIHIRLTREQVAWLDAQMGGPDGVSRAEAVRHLVQSAIDSRPNRRHKTSTNAPAQ